MKRTRPIRVPVLNFLAAFLLLLLGIAGPAQALSVSTQNDGSSAGKKINVCHHPSGQPDGVYNFLNVSTSTVFGGNGHDSHEGDIVPPFEGYNGSAAWQADPVRSAQILANGCSETPCPPTPTPTPYTPTPTPTPTTDSPTPTPTPTTDSPTPTPSPTPTTDSPSPTGSGTGEPTQSATATQGASGSATPGAGAGAASCVCPRTIPGASSSVSGPEGQSDAAVAPDGTVLGPATGATVPPCVTALAETGSESSGFPTGVVLLAVGALVAGAAAVMTTLFPRGSHG